MKRTTFITTIFMLLCMLLFVNSTQAYNNNMAGIGFRGTHWRMGDSEHVVHVQTQPGNAQVDVGNGGGYLYLFSRIDDNSFLELHFGAIGNVKAREEYAWGQEVDVNAVTPVLLGLRHHLFDYHSRMALQPYVVFGAGPYWFNDVFVRDDYMGFDEQVTVGTKARIGGYAGGGFNFMLSTWMGVNFDVKYHFINFNKDHEYSGYEFGLGLFFTWGEYKKSRVHRKDDDDNVNIFID